MSDSTPAGADHGPGYSRPARFATTRWCLVVAAGNRETPEARASLARLCQVYWYPFYAYVRRRGHAPDDAQDPLKHFLADEWDRVRAQKRGGGVPVCWRWTRRP